MKNVSPRWYVAAAAMIAAVSVAGCGHAKPATGAGAATPAGIPSAVAEKMLSPTACDTSAQNQSGSAWSISMPRTLCGLPADTSPDARKNGDALVQTETISLSDSLHPGIGTVKSSASGAWVTPDGLSAWRSITATGFTGQFSPSTALKVMETSGSSYHKVSPGPHGGVMACGISGGGTESCAFATTTTVGEFTLGDTSGELNKGGNADSIATEIRDALEAPVS